MTPSSTTADIAAGAWLLRAAVPDDTFTLAIEADDQSAAAEHAAFADRSLPLLRRGAEDDPERLRDNLIKQLGALRKAVAATGLGYLGALAGEHGDRPVLILLGIAAAPLEFPAAVDPASLLAAMLRRQYPDAAVEEFATASARAAGIRRCERISLSPDGEPVDAGISQALVPFTEAGLLGTVTGLSLTPAGIDIATVFTATIAHHMTVIRS